MENLQKTFNSAFVSKYSTSKLSNIDDSSFLQDQSYSSSSSSQSINQDENILNTLQKSKKRQAKVQESQVLNTKLLNPCRTIKLFSGIFITNDEALRFCLQPQLNQLWFLVTISFIYTSLPALPLKEALKFYKQFQNSDFIKISDRLEIYDNMMNKLRNQIYEMKLNKNCFQKKDEEFQDFIFQADSHIKQYARDNPNQMFQYTFGKINHIQGDVEITRAGYIYSYQDYILKNLEAQL
ncbi:hypothetical protein ABPG72_018968 [Tetrahymena utriculariae]